MIRPKKLQKDFPVLQNNPDLVYLDSTATSLKPQKVIDALLDYYETYSTSVHRGLYPIAAKATKAYEAARETIAHFVGASHAKEIVCTKNTSESLNLLAYAMEQKLCEGDEIITTAMEHHSNFLPWQALALRRSLKLTVLDITDTGMLADDCSAIAKKVTEKTKVVTLTHISNVTGVINPINEIVYRVKKKNPECIVVVDGAQSAPHIPVNVVDLGCDFFAFSLHKMLGPTGVGVLWGKEGLLRALPPFLYGGEMVESVSKDKSTFKELPWKFEAGTPHVAGVIASKAAIEYLSTLGMENVREHERQLLTYAFEKVEELFGKDIAIVGPQDTQIRTGSIAFLFKNHHPHDVAEVLGEENICIRAGRHCAGPLHDALSIVASNRASFSVYTDFSDVDALCEGLKKVDATLS